MAGIRRLHPDIIHGFGSDFPTRASITRRWGDDASGGGAGISGVMTGTASHSLLSLHKASYRASRTLVGENSRRLSACSLREPRKGSSLLRDVVPDGARSIGQWVSSASRTECCVIETKQSTATRDESGFKVLGIGRNQKVRRRRSETRSASRVWPAI
jgi:hypothetical protein